MSHSRMRVLRTYVQRKNSAVIPGCWSISPGPSMTSPTRLLRARIFLLRCAPETLGCTGRLLLASISDVTYQVNGAAVAIGVTMLVLPVKGQLHVFSRQPHCLCSASLFRRGLETTAAESVSFVSAWSLP